MRDHNLPGTGDFEPPDEKPCDHPGKYRTCPLCDASLCDFCWPHGGDCPACEERACVDCEECAGHEELNGRCDRCAGATAGGGA